MKGRKSGRTALLEKEKLFDMPSERTFVITRIINAPRALVFNAWTDPKRMSKWYGPKDFEVSVRQMDVRQGGSFRIVMRSPDGDDFPRRGDYRELVEPEELVFTENWEEYPDKWKELLGKYGADPYSKEALSTVIFEEHEGKTFLTIRILFDTAATHNAMIRMGINEAWSQSLDRLDEYLEKSEQVRPKIKPPGLFS